MATKVQNITRVMLYVADDLEDRGYAMAGLLRQLATQVATLAFDEPAEPGCCNCGRPIVQPRTGRPRKSCVDCSPPRKTHVKRDDSAGNSVHQRGAVL